MSTARRAYDMLRGYVSQEWERIQGVEDSFAESELNEALGNSTVAPTPKYTPPTQEPLTYARQILGVTEKADFAEIRTSFERLNKRSDPNNFPAGTREAREAAEIQKRVHWAYTTLTEGMDATAKRFGSLEI